MENQPLENQQKTVENPQSPVDNSTQPVQSAEPPVETKEMPQNNTQGLILRLIVFLLIAWGVYMLWKKPVEAPTKPQTIGPSLTIGFMAPLTGDAASYGESIKRGVELAKEKKGGNITILYQDTKCDAKEAINGVTKLITSDKVSAIIGEVCSGATLAAAPIAEKNKIPMISPASTSPKLSIANTAGGGAYTFRTVPSDALQGAFGAKLVFDKGFKRLAVIYSNEEYGVGFNKVLVSEFRALGGLVVRQEAINRNATDVRTNVTKVKAAKPDAVFLISNNPASAVALIKTLRELDVKAAVFASEGLKSEDITKGAGPASEGMIVLSVASGSDAFTQDHKTKYGIMPGPFAAQAYDAYSALVEAAKDGSDTGEKLQQRLLTISFEGSSGTIDFDENGDVKGNYEVYIVIQDGTFQKAQ